MEWESLPGRQPRGPGHKGVRIIYSVRITIQVVRKGKETGFVRGVDEGGSGGI